MLKFIVLGQIPGTAIQLNYDDILLIAAGFYSLILVIYELRRVQKATKRQSKAVVL